MAEGLAFRIFRVNDERLVARPLGEFRRIVIASPDYAAQHPLDNPADLARCNCLIFDKNTAVDDWTFQHRLDPERSEHVTVRGNAAVLGFHALLGMAETGAGFARVPDFITRRALAAGRVIHCLEDWASPPAPVFLAYRYGAERIGRVRAVIDEARRIIPGLLTGSFP